ncbi:MAG: beta-galactosidase, partial [Acidimicrobiia bacterium]|nr:beta-galactosidase [Acidimicrobiia bacterium]
MDPTDYLVPELTELHRLPARAPLVPHATTDEARAAAASPWRRSLDGDWRFRLVDRPMAAPRRWAEPSYDDGRWRSITVPGVWTRQHTADLPVYTNVQMPWGGYEPPAVPDDNPTGLHRITFRVPRAWRGRDVVLHVGGAESVLVVWCNGAFVGMGKDSRLPSEFDLTPHLVAGDNVLALMVIRWSDATWIEDQDHWFHAGVHRSVHLEARGRVRIDDLAVVADYDPDAGTGHLGLDALVRGDGAAIRVTVETMRGRRVAGPATAPVDRPSTEGGSLGRILSAYVY